MTKQFYFFAILALFLAPVNSFSQNLRLEAPPGYNFIYDENNLPKNMEGSPYLSDWQKADILLKNKETIKDLMVRYNVYKNQMLYQLKGKTYIIGAPDSIAAIRFPDKTFVYNVSIRDNRIEKGYFETLTQGKISLLKKYEVVIIHGNYNVALAVGNKNDRMEIRESLFLEHANTLKPIDKKLKIADAFPDKTNEVSAYVSKEGLSLKSPADLTKIVSFYNQL